MKVLGDIFYLVVLYIIARIFIEFRSFGLLVLIPVTFFVLFTSYDSARITKSMAGEVKRLLTLFIFVAFVIGGWIRTPVEPDINSDVLDSSGIYQLEDANPPIVDEFNADGESDYAYGIEAACNDLFSISEDGSMYQHSEELTFDDCLESAPIYSGDEEDPYDAGYWAVLDYLFELSPYWCWGNECLTIDDF